MERTFSLETGTLRCRTVGERLEILVELKNDGRGLYKAWMQGESGQTMEVGTLIPEQNCLRLRHSIPLQRIEEAGCWPLRDAGVRLIHAFGERKKEEQTQKGTAVWRREENAAHLFPRDSLLQTAATALKLCLYRSLREGFALAVPFARTLPFGLTPVFCFATVTWIEGKSYAVFCFSKDGVPQMPETDGEDRCQMETGG